jgi:hypothetical protein
VKNSLKELYVHLKVGAKTLRPLAKMQRLSKVYEQVTIDHHFNDETND